MTWLRIGAGAVALYLGTQWFVGGASRVVLALRAPRLIAGMTAVACGSSAAAVAIALHAASAGREGLALGVLIGANAANVGLILGITLLVRPTRVDTALSRRELPMLLGTTYALLAVLIDGRVTRLEAALLVAAAVGYAAWAPRWFRREALLEDAASVEATAAAAEACASSPVPGRAYAAGAACIGLGAVALGGDAFASGVAELTPAWKGSGLSLGLTLGAAGAALPGLVTSAFLARHGRPRVAIGNALAASIFNALVGLGVVGLIGNVAQHPDALVVDVPVLIVLTLLALFFLRSPRPPRRWEGALLLASYLAYASRLVGR